MRESRRCPRGGRDRAVGRRSHRRRPQVVERGDPRSEVLKSAVQTGLRRATIAFGAARRGRAERGRGGSETRDKLVKASALAEDDPRVAAALARVETVNADAVAAVAAARRRDGSGQVRHDLDIAIERARKEVEHARRVAPANAEGDLRGDRSARMQGDLALRTEARRRDLGRERAAGERADAGRARSRRRLIRAGPPPLSGSGRREHRAEPRRARALLVYALARSGDLGGRGARTSACWRRAGRTCSRARSGPSSTGSREGAGSQAASPSRRRARARRARTRALLR